MKRPERLTTHDMGEWLEWRRRNHYQTILLLGSRAGALYRSLPFYDYCQRYSPHNLQTHPPTWSFRECYHVLLQQQLGERELHALLQDSFKHIGNLVGIYDEDGYFADIVKRGYFREIISTNIDDIVERALHSVRLIENKDFEVFLPGKPPRSLKRSLPYRLTKVFGDWQSRDYAIYRRDTYIAEHQALYQHLHMVLQSHVLAIGIDPLWDSGILPLLQDIPTSLWFVNGEEDILYDQPIKRILDQAKAVAAIGPNYGYEEFWQILHQQLRMKSMLSDRGMQDWHPPSVRDGNNDQQENKAIRILYLYCHDDLPLMQKFWQQLHVLRTNQLITEWHWQLLAPGEDSQVTQERELRNAQIIFIGFSPGFLSSEYYDQALQAFRLYQEGAVTLVPLRLRTISNWKQTPFSSISSLPRGDKALRDFSSKDIDKELSVIADDIYKLVMGLMKSESIQ